MPQSKPWARNDTWDRLPAQRAQRMSHSQGHVPDTVDREDGGEREREGGKRDGLREREGGRVSERAG